MSEVSVTIDGAHVSVEAGATLLQAADAAGVYVPRLCAHPSMATCGRCGVCAVEVEGSGVVWACETAAKDGDRVAAGSAAAQRARVEALSRLLAIHPHVCLTCDLREGCSRSQCSYNTQVEERCCQKFGSCEFQKAAYFIGIPQDAPTYAPKGLPIADEGLYSRNLNLCIGCLRCEDACREIAGAKAVSDRRYGELILAAPSKGETMKEAGCVYCGACVQVCPTGALLPKKDPKGKRWIEKTVEKLALRGVPEPPKSTLRLDERTIGQVPATEGVYQLYDASGEILKICGVIDLREGLLEELEDGNAASFTYEEDPLYTSRESQLIQQYLAQHGKMPGGDDDLF